MDNENTKQLTLALDILLEYIMSTEAKPPKKIKREEKLYFTQLPLFDFHTPQRPHKTR